MDRSTNSKTHVYSKRQRLGSTTNNTTKPTSWPDGIAKDGLGFAQACKAIKITEPNYSVLVLSGAPRLICNEQELSYVR